VYEELSHVEKAWNQFLEKLDLLMKRNSTGTVLQQGQIFPLHSKLFTVG
jgi:hypothetical protein